ncbi:MAG TPA: ABC transporter ATP-binding protein [Nitrospiria bacterium]|nr:ABC transporter ATP-binding protein [Nitrospiria bacterium]
MPDQLLSIDHLATHLETTDGIVKAVNDVSLTVTPGRVLGLVGESGCGKTMTALSVMRIVPPPGRIVGGAIRFQGVDLLALPEREMQRVRGRRIAMIFQEPMTALNPVLTVGEQIAEMLRYHLGMRRGDARSRAIELLRQVGVPSPDERYRAYPHQLSGGLRQRVMIAMAISCEPALIFADEPTTALDVTIQAQILDLLRRLQRELRLSVVLISHDLGVIAQMADEVAVMYAGRIVEQSSTATLFNEPLHPYTQGLMKSLPRRAPRDRRQRLTAIPGSVPQLQHLPSGCAFHPRCPVAIARCAADEPALKSLAPGHDARCWVAEAKYAQAV